MESNGRLSLVPLTVKQWRIVALRFVIPGEKKMPACNYHVFAGEVTH
jgi:hypothetical protein